EIADREPDLLDASLAHLKGGEVESRERRLVGKLPLGEAGRHLAQSPLRPALPAEADLDPGFEPAQLEPLGRPRRRRVERSSAREDGAGEREEPGAGKAGGEGVDGGESELRIAPGSRKPCPATIRSTAASGSPRQPSTRPRRINARPAKWPCPRARREATTRSSRRPAAWKRCASISSDATSSPISASGKASPVPRSIQARACAKLRSAAARSPIARCAFAVSAQATAARSAAVSYRSEPAAGEPATASAHLSAKSVAKAPAASQRRRSPSFRERALSSQASAFSR